MGRPAPISFTALILDDVDDPFARRQHVAQSYAAAIRYRGEVDWPRVNAAIVDRWSVYGLKWIKREAWKIV